MNLQKNKKIAVLINAIAIVIAVIMVVPMLFYMPISTLFDMEQGMFAFFAFWCFACWYGVVYGSA